MHATVARSGSLMSPARLAATYSSTRFSVAGRNGLAPGTRCSAATSLDAALALADSAPLVHVIGGAEVYALALPIADELQLTEIDAQFPADVFFPPWDRERFAEVAREPRQTAEGLRYAFVTYKKLPEGD